MLLVLPIWCCSSFAQEKLFEDAIKSGLTSKGCYHAKNSKKKFIDAGQINAYASSKGYIMLRLTEMRHVRFGNATFIVDEFEFIEPNNYQNFVFRALAGEGFDFNRIKGSGKLFIDGTNKVYENNLHELLFYYYGDNTQLTPYDAMWTGNIIDGCIDGPGTGCFTMPNGLYLKLEGTFSYGFPTSDIHINYVTKNYMRNPVVSQEEIKQGGYGIVSHQIYINNLETTDPILKKALLLRAEKMYSDDVKSLESHYDEIKSLSVSNYESITLDNFAADFAEFYQKTNYDPQNKLPKAFMMMDAYTVVTALKMPIREHYYGYTLWSILTMFYDWLGSAVDNDRGIINTGMQKARSRKNEDSVLKPFFTQAYDLLVNKSDTFENKVESDRLEYNRMVDREKAERRTRDEQLSKEIDWGRSKEPSGEISKGLFDTYASNRNPGEIRFKSGSDYVEYNAFYNGKKLIFYKIVYASTNISNRMGSEKYKEYKSLGELVEAVLKAR